MSILDQYKKCRVCGQPLNESLAAYALHRFEQQACSSECRQRDIIKRFGCCDKATFRNCVCMYSFECPDHGIKCVGTHD